MLVLKQANLLHVTTESSHSLKISSNQSIRKCQISYNCFSSLVFPQSVFTSIHFTSLSENSSTGRCKGLKESLPFLILSSYSP